jgi:hypothetical protein
MRPLAGPLVTCKWPKGTWQICRWPKGTWQKGKSQTGRWQTGHRPETSQLTKQALTAEAEMTP